MGDEKLLREIGARIDLRRKELDLTQEQLAELMDVSIQMISNLELGKKAIRPENLVKLCAVLDVSADHILLSSYWDLLSIDRFPLGRHRHNRLHTRMTLLHFRTLRIHPATSKNPPRSCHTHRAFEGLPCVLLL